MRGTRLILLDHGVDLLHAGEGLLEDHLRHALVGHGLRVVRILGLPVLARPLHLLLHLRDGGRRGLNLLVEVVDGLFEVGDLGLQAGLHVVGLLGRAVVFVELVDAPVAVLDLVLLLPLQLNDHLVNLLLDLREGIQLRRGGQHEKRRVVRLLRDLTQELGGLMAAAALAAGGELHEALVGAAHRIAGLVTHQDLDGLRDRLHLLQARLLAPLEVRVVLGAHLVQVHHELLVFTQHLLLLSEVLLRLSKCIVGVCELVLLLLLHFLGFGDLRLLGIPELGEGCGALLLDLLGLGKVATHLLLQLFQHPEDLAALRGVRRHVGLLVVRLHEGGRGLQGALDDLGVGGGPLLALVGTAAAGHGPVLLL
mmetsp:Transcript_95729/g.252979  ORF Transcript_95729/g.252979 Transcript_95729/m.252979 type:complete len:366 (+) Transcript_95729:516-1613(+)